MRKTDTTQASTGSMETDNSDLPQPKTENLSYTQRPMIPVELLAAHPGNVRTDTSASADFCRSVAQVGVLVPLEITYEPERAGYRVVDGNVRLDAALKVGLKEVPYVFSSETVDNDGLQKLHMLVTSHWRTGLTPKEEAQALFDAAELGMSATEIRQATGLKRAEIKTALRAGNLTEATHADLAKTDYEWTLDEMALIAEFQDDPEAMHQIMDSRTLWHPSPLRYVVQRIRDNRAEVKRREKIVASLTANNIQVADRLPEKGVELDQLLTGDGEVMDAHAHANCPGHRATLDPWQGAVPQYFCDDPALHRHLWVATGTTERPKTSPDRDRNDGTAATGKDLTRKIVIEGNLAWSAASKVRQEFLSKFLDRKSPPKKLAATIAKFVACQYMTMPQPLCRALGGTKNSTLFDLDKKLIPSVVKESAGRSSLPGLWMLALVPIASSYEREMVGSGERRNTWRSDRYSPCDYFDAGEWLRFCIAIGAETGWEPSPIERAIAAGRPYRGDLAEEENPEATGEDATSTDPKETQNVSDSGSVEADLPEAA